MTAIDMGAEDPLRPPSLNDVPADEPPPAGPTQSPAELTQSRRARANSVRASFTMSSGDHNYAKLGSDKGLDTYFDMRYLLKAWHAHSRLQEHPANASLLLDNGWSSPHKHAHTHSHTCTHTHTHTHTHAQ